MIEFRIISKARLLSEMVYSLESVQFPVDIKYTFVHVCNDVNFALKSTAKICEGLKTLTISNLFPFTSTNGL